MEISPDTFISIFVISGSIFAFFFAIAHFLTPRPGKRNIVEGILFLLFSLWFFLAFYRIFVQRGEDIFFAAGIFLFLFFVPTLYLYMRLLLDPGFLIQKKHLLYFAIPCILSFLVPLSLELPSGFYGLLNISPFSQSIRRTLVTALAFISNLYLCLLLFYLNFLYGKRFLYSNNDKERYLPFIFILNIGLNMIFLFYFINFFLDLELIRYSYFSGTVLVFYFFIIYLRFPEISALNLRQSQKSIEKTLKGIDADNIVTRMEFAMNREKLYLDETLNLGILAGKMGITSHQLSAVLNSILKTNYYSYVNRFRINEAISILNKNEAIKVIEVAHNAGFNSLSVFYKAFKDETGMSPKEYKKDLLRETEQQ